MNIQYGSGRSRFGFRTIQHPVGFAGPLDLDAESYSGVGVLGDDGAFWLSVQQEGLWKWIKLNRAIELIENPITLTVHHSAPADFDDIDKALAWCAERQPAPNAPLDVVLVTIRLLAGFVPQRPIQVRSSDLSFVEIIADDATISVPYAVLTLDYWGAGLPQRCYFNFINCDLPDILCTFVLTYSSFDSNGLDTSGNVLVGLKATNCIWNNGRNTFISGRTRGFRNFSNALILSGGDYTLFQYNLQDSKRIAIQVLRSSCTFDFVTTANYGNGGSVLGGLFAQFESTVFIASGCDFRRLGSEAITDISVRRGTRITIELDATNPNFGGTNNIAHIPTSAGLISDMRVSPPQAVYARNNAIAAVSNSGANPTGGIVERVENANGRARRWIGGDLQCWRDDLSVASVSTAYGSRFRSADLTWTFPAAFLSGSQPVPQAMALNADCDVRLISRTNTTATFRVVSDVSIATAVTVGAYAQGRWSAMI